MSTILLLIIPGAGFTENCDETRKTTKRETEQKIENYNRIYKKFYKLGRIHALCPKRVWTSESVLSDSERWYRLLD